MKRILIIMLTIPLLMALTWRLQLSADYTVENNDDGTINLTITVENGSPEFVFLLYDQAPWNDGQLIESKENVKENTVTFPMLKKMDYYVMIQDADKNIISVTISISKEESN